MWSGEQEQHYCIRKMDKVMNLQHTRHSIFLYSFCAVESLFIISSHPVVTGSWNLVIWHIIPRSTECNWNHCTEWPLYDLMVYMQIYFLTPKNSIFIHPTYVNKISMFEVYLIEMSLISRFRRYSRLTLLNLIETPCIPQC